MILSERLFAIHDALTTGGIPHAFGGAIALGFCIAEPRGTRDLDLNIFLPTARFAEVLHALPEAVSVRPEDIETLQRDDQVRLRWADTPVDLFFECDGFHEVVATRARTVPYEGRRIPVIDCGSLAVFKTMFNRSRDWADLEAMVEVGSFDFEWVLEWLHRLIGPGDEAAIRFAELRPRWGTADEPEP